MELTLALLTASCCALMLVTVWAYERLLREERARTAEVMADADLFSELLNESLAQRHPSTRAAHRPSLRIVGGEQ